MKKICVFCGSSSGVDPVFVKKARKLGNLMAKKELGLVYGGASIGVMGAIADGCMESGGKVWGVIPKQIVSLEVGHQGLENLEVVEDMHTRKARMYELSDAFFALPGGIGTMDELCEVITWAQLKYHEKPCYVINIDGFFDHLLRHFRHINQQGFLSNEHLGLVKEFPTYEEAILDFESNY